MLWWWLELEWPANIPDDSSLLKTVMDPAITPFNLLYALDCLDSNATCFLDYPLLIWLLSGLTHKDEFSNIKWRIIAKQIDIYAY